jgi:uncharacterized membrane protein
MGYLSNGIVDLKTFFHSTKCTACKLSQVPIAKRSLHPSTHTHIHHTARFDSRPTTKLQVQNSSIFLPFFITIFLICGLYSSTITALPTSLLSLTDSGSSSLETGAPGLNHLHKYFSVLRALEKIMEIAGIIGFSLLGVALVVAAWNLFWCFLDDRK